MIGKILAIIVVALVIITIVVFLVVPIRTEGDITKTAQVASPDEQERSEDNQISGTTTAEPWQIIFCFAEATDMSHGFIRYYVSTPDPNINILICNPQDDLVALFTKKSLVVLFNDTVRDLSGIPPSHVLGISHEPTVFSRITPELIARVKQSFGAYYIGDAAGLPSPFQSHYSYICGKLPRPSMPKSKLMSIMVSDQNVAKGHKYRHELVHAILKTTLPIDIWGRGADAFKRSYPTDARICGGFQDEELYTEYQFSIAIENVQEANYISEKFTNCIANHTTPIYLGCSQLTEYFGENAAVLLTGQLSADLLLLAQIVETPEKFVKDLSFARAQLLPGGQAHLLTHIKNEIFPRLH